MTFPNLIIHYYECQRLNKVHPLDLGLYLGRRWVPEQDHSLFIKEERAMTSGEDFPVLSYCFPYITTTTTNTLFQLRGWVNSCLH